MTIKIEKSVPMPEKQTRSAKYPWDDMEAGDSFFVADMTGKSIAGAVAHARKARDIQLITRTVEEDGVKGVRVWRVG